MHYSMTFEIIDFGAMITAVFIGFLTMSYIYTFKRSWPYLNVRNGYQNNGR